ncbi:hypothetical protein DPMN_018090 [Dreissena polymorpha]|uniref:Uncharacterized protein n=1 Tax=Dreissena polymorpha TaxID=45954 RepID=A0A9D4NIS0_DREPO|nr:hypothetical protein DPMN_186543 [Dreissena polymorpha]KAH3893937.1 hypothetical protein DPMN_018090 [Dreissena polymorpha]
MATLRDMCVLLVIFNCIYASVHASKNSDCVNTYCKRDPCEYSDPEFMCANHPLAECRANYCNGCNYGFWENGVELADCLDVTFG